MTVSEIGTETGRQWEGGTVEIVIMHTVRSLKILMHH